MPRLGYEGLTITPPAFTSWVTFEPGSPSRGRVLCLGRYPTLLDARTATLRRAGFEVESLLLVPLTVKVQPIDGSFDVVILCRSLNSADAKVIAIEMRERYPTAHILRIVLDPGEASAAFHSTSQSLQNPSLLLGELAEIVRWRKNGTPVGN